MGKTLLLEIGTEEIPAAFLTQAMADMESLMEKELATTRLPHGKIKAMATPRRLVLFVHDLAERQEDEFMEKLGPAAAVAFDQKGNPTPAAVGFAKSQRVALEDLEVVETNKGKYVAVRKRIKGEETLVVLSSLLPRFIGTIPFRKSMRWSHFDLRFARPIHWILALFGDEVVPFNLDHLRSGNLSFGHRFMSPCAFSVEKADDYMELAKKHFVIPDPAERKKIILEEAQACARTVEGEIFFTAELLETVTNLVEYPVLIKGDFEVAFLSLPKEVLMTTMIVHQKYFPLMDREGKLLPHFLTVANTKPRDPAIVKKGNERVLRARLRDAQFFFTEDRKIPLSQRLEQLRGTIFHTLLGTSYEKVMRIKVLAQEICTLLNYPNRDRVDRVATLAKVDLTTQMVGEFPELQGIMGREYARLDGEEEVVCQAIYEHYLPLSAGGDLPRTEEGAIVSIADKLDTICGFFAVGLIPTGTADPYALRRQALGIINIILDRRYCLPLDVLVDKGLTLLKEKLRKAHEVVKEEILAFFKGRLENLFLSQGHPYDVVDAVLATEEVSLLGIRDRIFALEEIKKEADFEPLAVACKRIGNIIKGFSGGAVDPSLFENEAERSLYSVYLGVEREVKAYIEKGDYFQALKVLARLRTPVDNFFDAVLVMTDEEKIRKNRLSLLTACAHLFGKLADFSRLTTQAAP